MSPEDFGHRGQHGGELGVEDGRGAGDASPQLLRGVGQALDRLGERRVVRLRLRDDLNLRQGGLQARPAGARRAGPDDGDDEVDARDELGARRRRGGSTSTSVTLPSSVCLAPSSKSSKPSSSYTSQSFTRSITRCGSKSLELRPNTGNLGSSDDVDQIWWWLDEVSVDGFLGGERGAVGSAYDAGVVPAAALVEPFEHLSDRLSGGAA